jgi:hypothetical protein
MHRLLVTSALLLALVVPACGGNGTSGGDALDGSGDVDARLDVGQDGEAPDALNPDAPQNDAGPEAEAAIDCSAAPCFVAGTVKCQDPGTVVTCADADGDGCLEWASPAPCENGTVCSNGECAATCTSECTDDGATLCEGNGVLTCADRNDDGCLEWGAAVPCGAAQTCSGGACVDEVGPLAAGDVLFTELMPNTLGGSDDTGEWFELYNASAFARDLAGCVLADASPPGVTLEASLVIPPGGYRLLAVSGDAAANFGLVDPYVYAGFSLSNSGEPLSLTCGDVLVDAIAWTANMVQQGVAIQLSTTRLDATANDDPAAWCDATATYGTGGQKGTPGAANGECPIVLPATTPDTAGQLVITELMAKSGAGSGDKGEWFELHNASAEDLDLYGCWLADKNPEQYQFVEHVVVPASGYLVLALSNDPAVNFGLVDPHVYQGFSLSNEGEALSLSCGATVIDAISFTAAWVTDGVAHQLSSASLSAVANDDDAAWCPAVADFGTASKKGTPGAPNAVCD